MSVMTPITTTAAAATTTATTTYSQPACEQELNVVGSAPMCRGKKKAVFIGINYFGSKAELKGGLAAGVMPAAVV